MFQPSDLHLKDPIHLINQAGSDSGPSDHDLGEALPLDRAAEMGSGRMRRGPSDQGAGRFCPLDRTAEGSRIVLVFIDSFNCLDYGWILTDCDGGRPMVQKYGALDLDQRRSDHRVM